MKYTTVREREGQERGQAVKHTSKLTRHKDAATASVVVGTHMKGHRGTYLVNLFEVFEVKRRRSKENHNLKKGKKRHHQNTVLPHGFSPKEIRDAM